jgi:bacterioferritin
MNNTNVKELNALLKGEYMAVDAYENYIQTIADSEVRDELQKIQQDHKLHSIMIAERIQSLGGKPVNGIGIAGKVAETINNIKHRGIKDPVNILKNAYDGEDQGIKMATEIVKGDLDSESSELIKDILNGDREHLNSLNNLLQKKGGLD